MSDEKMLDMITSGMGNNPMTTMMALLLRSQKNLIDNTTPEERERLKKEREARRAEEYRVSMIRTGKCPTCKTKLVRGKKNKKNNHKRSWKCMTCETEHLA